MATSKSCKEINPLEKHGRLESLMLAIFGNERSDPRLPVCYPYILVRKGGKGYERDLRFFERFYLEKSIDEVLESLPKSKGNRDSEEWNRGKRVLEFRFGLLNGRPMTLEGVAKSPDFEVTKERIREMEQKALRILRHPSRSNRLKGFFVPAPEDWFLRH